MKILIIDDEVTSRTKLFKIMSKLGECVVSSSGDDALSEFNRAWVVGVPFNLVMLDIGLADMSGIEVLKAIRIIEKGRAKKSKVIMVTSYSDKESITESVKAGCNSYIVKPFNPDDVFEKLQHLGIM